MYEKRMDKHRQKNGLIEEADGHRDGSKGFACPAKAKAQKGRAPDSARKAGSRPPALRGNMPAEIVEQYA